MIKRVKPGKGKAVSSYLLSGVNIKKIIAEEKVESLQSNQNGEFNIIRIGRHPIFRVHAPEKQEETVEHNLPSKSFKIRSFTKKLRDASEVPKLDSSCEVYEKIEFVRNLRAINNRIDAFNPSRLSHLDRGRKLNESVGGSANVHSKMRQIFKRQSSMKCKVGSQIFVKEFYQFPQKLNEQPNLKFQNISTNRYREVASKIHVVYNQNYRESDSCTLLIVSVDSLTVNKKKIIKTNTSVHEQPMRSCQMNGNLWSQQTVELIKMIASEAQTQIIDLKLAFKVKDLASLQSLRHILEGIKSNYHSIFFPICKYCEEWNLYLIDPLLNRTKEIILLQERQSFQTQFPVLGDGFRSIFIGTQNDNFLSLSRTIQALKSFLCNKTQKDQDSLQNSLEVDSTIRQRLLPYANSQDGSKKVGRQSEPQPQLFNSSFNIKEEIVHINSRALQAYLNFVVESRLLRNQKTKRRVSKTRRDSDNKRGALCQIEVNIPEFSISNDPSNEGAGKSLYLQNLDEIYENLIQNFKHTISDKQKSINSTRNRQSEVAEKGEDIEEIMGYLRGSSLKNRSLGQNISELVRKNNHILKQISQFLQSKQYISITQSSKHKKNYAPLLNNVVLDQNLDTSEDKGQEMSTLQFRIYRIS